MERRHNQPQPTRKERREQAREERRIAEDRQERFHLQRRALLRFGVPAIAIVAVGGAAVLSGAGENLLNLISPEKEEQFSGEVEETKGFLAKWDQEVKKDPKLLEKFHSRILDLSVSYFSQQMGYDKARFKDRISFVDHSTYVKKFLECGKAPTIDDVGVSIIHDDKAYIDNTYVSSSRGVLMSFVAVLHELHHLAPPKIHHEQGIRIPWVDNTIVYEKGLTVFSKNVQNSKEGLFCPITSRYQIEEAVVQHATNKMFANFGPGVYMFATGYDEVVGIYENSILNPLFGGDYKELLRFQQNSDGRSFFEAIGKKLGATTSDTQFELGNLYTSRLLSPLLRR